MKARPRFFLAFPVLFLLPLLLAPARAQDQPPEPPPVVPPVPADAQAFEAYWSRGLAELTSYQLEQSRYGEIHPGSAVLIFVTEDLSRSRQVKLDRPEKAGEDRYFGQAVMLPDTLR